MSKTIQEQIEIMKHFANGGEIQCDNGIGYSEFAICKSPSWNWEKCNYRIKEQKETIIIEKWLMQNTSDLDYFVIETSNIKIAITGYVDGLVNAIRVIDTYKVEL